MSQPAEILDQSAVSNLPVRYEQPLNERMRTFLRLEYLYQQFLYHIELRSEWASRNAISSLLDIIAILSRGDVRSDVLKELERQIYLFDQYQNLPEIDEGRLGGVLRNLENFRKQVIAIGPQYLVAARESEFLNSVKHRSAIPGGTCEFDLPDYNHWLRKPFDSRLADLQFWMTDLTPVCGSVAELLWLYRKSGTTYEQVAVGGVFQHSLSRGSANNLLRVILPPRAALYPEISGSHHRFTIRFMEWSDARSRAVQNTSNIKFQLTIC